MPNPADLDPDPPWKKNSLGAKFGSMPNLSSGYTQAVLTSTTNTGMP